VGAFDLDGLQLLVLDEEKLASADLVASALVVGVDRFAGSGIRSAWCTNA
jgi:hypothetical protein